MKKNTILESDKAVAEELDKQSGKTDNFIRLSTGVVLLAKQANPHILIRVMTAKERPDPPLVYMEAMGREMENPDAPDYIARVQAWEMSYNNSMLNALIGTGTELYSKPKSMAGPDDDKWLSDYKSFGLPVHPESPSWRYITWVLFMAATTSNDTSLIGEKVRRLSGVKEADVQAATTFPGSN